MGDKLRGIYNKFSVERTDGSDQRGGKHEGCEYFVLDLDHDPHAMAAIKAYADSCRVDYPMLADDLMDLARTSDFGRTSPNTGGNKK